MSSIIGTVSYASGEQKTFTDPKAFIKTVKEELPYRSTSGFAYTVMDADPATRKAIDDLAYNEYGEENPHDLAHYQNTEIEHQIRATEALNTSLYEKMSAEQESFERWLLTQPPEEILHHSSEYTTREDILMTLEFHDLTVEQASALLVSPSPLEDVYREFQNRDTNLMDTVLDCITSRANDVVQAEEEQRLALLNLPVYRYPAAYAREHDELEQYRASYKASVACKMAIEAVITDHYHDNSLGHEAVKAVVEQFGYERTLYVLANTVRQKNWDGRISHDNKDWARTIPVHEDVDGFGTDRNVNFVVDAVHPGLTDIFTKQARREYLLTQPITKEEIQMEASRILGRLQSEHSPNSPSGTHFMAQISPDFLLRASSKDRERLYSMLPFTTLTFSALNERDGIYALISKEETREKSLRPDRESARAKLQQKPPQAERPASPKKHTSERESH
jgi:hypothetical protein